MTSTTRKSPHPFIMGLFACIVACISATAAYAQCTSITVTNNAGCALRLCLYNPTASSQPCYDIPATGSVVINLPTGFVPAGGISSSGREYRFSTSTGCTACYSQITTSSVQCCAMVCYDAVACTIIIGNCTSSVCEP